MTERSRFAGGDQAYLRDVQYRNSEKLAARANLHAKYGAGDWFSWWAGQYAWPAQAEVLEVGCGAGWVWTEAKEILTRGLALTLTDQSRGMVAEALAHVGEPKHYRSLAGLASDAQHLPFGGQRFDVVVANHMLYHLPEPERALTELTRVMCPNAVALIATNGRDHLKELWEIRAEVFPSLAGPDQTVEVFGIETGEPMLFDRFESVALRRYPDRLRCTDADDVFAFMMSTPPAEDSDDAQRIDMRAAIDARFDQGGGVFEITKDVGLFICRGQRSESSRS